VSPVIFQQVPWFSEHLPEELCVATYLNVAAACAALCAFVYFFLTENRYKVPHSVAVPALLALSFIASVFVAFTYDYTIHGNSFYLFAGHFLATIVGAFSSIIFNPFMAQYEAKYISAARGGGSTAILFSAVLGLIQSPGKDPRFSPTVFVLIFSGIFIFPFFAYRIIVRDGIGLRQVSANSDENQSVNMDDSKVLLTSSYTSSETVDKDRVQVEVIHKPFVYMWNKPWFKFTLPYALSIGWVNYNTWGMLSAITPFALDYAAVNVSKFLLLALAYEIGAFALVLGDLSTMFVRLPFNVSLFTFTVASFSIYLAALNLEGFHTPASGPILVVCFSVGRFYEAHILTSSFRAIANNLPHGQRDEASRMLGLFDQISTTLGIITSTVLITLLVDCHTEDD
jgi:hypothetical protein